MSLSVFSLCLPCDTICVLLNYYLLSLFPVSIRLIIKMPLSKCFPCLQFKNEEVINKLDYSNTVLTEVFPLVWQHERTLEELYLTSTRINNLPPQLFYCQGLKILHANNNNIENIPDAVGTLRQLQQLNLNRNYISSVPESIKSCKNLTHLDLSCNVLQRLPDAITSLISLQELLLNETYMEFLPANFGRLVNLRIVELRLNNLVSLPKSMQRLTNLQRLDIGGNEFTKMPDVIFELKQLREFWFDFNQIRLIPPMVGKLRELQHFEANGNFISSLPNEISNWHNLEVISISTNDLTTFPFSIGMLKSLVTFKCETNELTELPDSISNLENLEELVISHNKVKRLPNTIGMLRKLRYLFADDNDLRQLPEEICSCSNLSVLSISRNKISELPSNIGHLRQLKVLNIVQNHIATLPVSVFSLVNLTSLWISTNQSQPLVPLQYVDATKKTHLTCFMLPQVGSKQANKNNEETDELYNSIRRQPAHTAPPNNCVSPTRRICFAEETTILNTNQTLPTASEATRKPNNYNGDEAAPQSMPRPVSPSLLPMPSNAYSNSSGSGTSQTRDINLVPTGHKDLVRSPTPYPKELRLMAKYLRRNQQYQQVVNTGEPITMTEAQQEIEFVPSSQSATYVTNYALHHAAGEGTQHVFQPHTSNINWQQSLNENEHRSSVAVPNGNLYYENGYNMATFNGSIYQQVPPSIHSQNEYYYHQQQEPTQLQSQSPEQIYYHSNIMPMMENLTLRPSNGNGLVDPPPYHIARSFTKKTQEDLTNYEVIRQKQHQQHTNMTTENIDVHSQDIYQMIQSVKKETDYQNNLKTAHITNNDNQVISQTSTSQQTNNHSDETPDGVGPNAHSENNNASANTTHAPMEITNTAKSKTPWLFGVHKNPTVKQISLKWEIQRGFDIDSMPNKEGIYVTSITSGTEAARLLCLYDKLLDVDGNDFTSISLSEAHQVLNNTGNVISIMLSRR
ncbi:leucine rich repeat containing protein 7 lap1 [Haematobia irritans]|uniref:leucine rich repeat containing protein 7 lap1 n=1 Tax=Haematobia irritans TaxID=7368 RepID=UPI003F4FE603